MNNVTVPKLLNIVQDKLNTGTKKFVILISSGGGNVFYALSAFNFLKGISAEVITHNFGSVDSSAGVIFCAGSKRYCVPQARFLIHPVTWGYPQGADLSEEILEENLKSLKQDTENIAGVLSSTTGKSKSDILEAMKNRTNLNPVEAKDFGLIHEIKTELVEDGAEVLRVD